MVFTPRSLVRSALRPLGIAALVAAAGQASAAVYYKANNTTDITSLTSWLTTEAGSTNPTSIASTDALWFGGSGQGAGAKTVSLGGNLSVAGIRLDNITGTPNTNITINGGVGQVLTLNAGESTGMSNATYGIFLNSAAGGTLTINADVAIGASQSWVSSRNLTVNGGVNLGASRTLTLNSAANTIAVSGVITGTGSSGISRAGVGTVTISGVANDFGGQVVLTGGTTNVAKLANIGSNSSFGTGNSSSAIVMNGAALVYTGSGDTSNRAIDMRAGATVNTSGSGALVLNAANVVQGGIFTSRTLTLGGTYATLGSQFGMALGDATGATTLSSAFASGATTITLSSVAGISVGASISGAGIAGGTTITAVNTSTRVVTLSAATTGASAAAGNAAYTVTGVINRNSLLKVNAAAWDITAANTYTGTTTIQGGILRVTGSGVLGGLAGSTAVDNNISFSGTGAAVNSELQFETAANLGASTQIRWSNQPGGSMAAGAGGMLRYIGTTNQVVTQNIMCDTSFGIRLASNSVGGKVVLSGTWSAVNTARPVYLEGTGTGLNEISGAMNTGAITKRDAGTWLLSGNNTFGTAVTVSGGTLMLGHANALGNTTGATSVTAGALDLYGQAIGAEAVTISGTGISSGGALINSAASSASLTGAVTLGANASAGGSGNFTLSGAVGGAFTLTKVGAGTLTLSNSSNTYSGGTTVAGGTLSVTGAITGTTTVSSGATLSGTGTTGAVTLQAGGNLSGGVGGAGSLTVGNVEVAASSTANLVISTLSNYASSAAVVAGNLTLNGGSVLNLTVSGFAIGQDYKLLSYTGANPFTEGVNLTLNHVNKGRLTVTLDTATSGLIMYDVTGSKNYWTGANGGVWNKQSAANWSVVADSDTTVFLDGDAIVFDGTGANNAITIAETVTPGTIEVAGANDYSFSGSFGIAGSGSLTKTGAGKLTVSTANTFSGGASLQEGRVVIGSETALGSGTFTFAGGSLSATTGATRTLTNQVAFTSDTILGDATDNGGLVFSTGAVSLGGSGARTLDVRSAVTLGGALSGNALTKTGAGTLTLSGTNGSYGGAVTVSNGTLVVGGATSLGTGGITVSGSDSALTLAANPSGAGAFTLGGGAKVASDGATARTVASALTLNGDVTLGDATNTGGITFSNTVSLADGNRAITTAAGTTSTLSGVVSSPTAASGALTKGGNGTLVLSNANTYAGGTTLNAGVLQIGNVAGLGTGALTVNGGTFTSGGTQLAVANNITLNSNLTFTGTADTQGLRLNGLISGSGGIIASLSTSGNGGRVTLAGDNTFTGDTSVNSGYLAIGLNALAQSASVTIGASGVLAIASNGGDTILNNLGGSGTISSQFNMVTDGLRAIKVNQSSDGVFSGVITQGGSARAITFTKSGAGSLTLGHASTAYTMTGGLNLSQGTLIAASATALGSGGTITVNDAQTGANNTTIRLNSVTVARAITVANQGSGTVTLGANGSVGLPEFSGAITLAKDVTLDGSTNTDRLTFTGGIGGTGNVNITGTGRVVFLTNANTYVGNTDIAANSILQLGTSATSVSFIPDASVVTVGSGGFLKLGKGSNNETIGGLSGSGTVRVHENAVFNNAVATLTVDNAANHTFSGVLENGGASGATLGLTKSGAGKQTLSGNNTYTGNTSISGGTLEVTGTLGSGNYGGTIALSNSAVLAIASASAQTLSGSITGTGSLTKSGGGNLTLSLSSNAVTGITLSGGTLTAGTAGGLGSNGISVNGGTLDLNGQSVGNALTLSSGTLANASGYTGTATVTGAVNVSGSIGGVFDLGLAANSTTVTAGSGTAFTNTLQGVGTIAGDITVTGAHNPGNSPGIQTINGDLTYSGGSSTVQWELTTETAADNQAGIAFDRIVVNGDLTFSAATALTLVFDGAGSDVLWSDAFWGSAHSWLLFDVGGATFSFSNLSLTDTFVYPLDNKVVSRNVQDSSDATLVSVRSDAGFYLGRVGDDIRLYYRPVPEPSTYGLILGGLALAGAAVRRRRAGKTSK